MTVRNLLLLVLLSLTTLRPAMSGDREGNGGDPIAAEFISRGYFIYNYLKMHPEIGILNIAESSVFKIALENTRVAVIEHGLIDRNRKLVMTLVTNDPSNPQYALIQLSKSDWSMSKRLGINLVEKVFEAYLLASGVNNANSRISSRLILSEQDYQSRPLENPDCLGGQLKAVRINLSISPNFSGLREISYMNGVPFDSESSRSSYRVYQSQRLCTLKKYRFTVMLGSYTRTVDLFGGAVIKLNIESP